MRAAQLAGAHEFISELPEGYDTIVGEQGASLSRRPAPAHRDRPGAVHQPAHPDLRRGHQRARLRERSDPPAQHGAICKGRTVIIIAHRLSSVRHAHRIVVMDKGRIVEDGPHDELLRAADGPVRAPVAMQAGAAGMPARPRRSAHDDSCSHRRRIPPSSCWRATAPSSAPPGRRAHELAGPKRLADEAAFLPAALSLQETPVHPAPRRVAVGDHARCSSSRCVGASSAQIDIVAVAPGRIVVSERTKTIQPLERSVVKRVLVKDGDTVQGRPGAGGARRRPTPAPTAPACDEQLESAAVRSAAHRALLQALRLRPALRRLAAARRARRTAADATRRTSPAAGRVAGHHRQARQARRRASPPPGRDRHRARADRQARSHAADRAAARSRLQEPGRAGLHVQPRRPGPHARAHRAGARPGHPARPARRSRRPRCARARTRAPPTWPRRGALLSERAGAGRASSASSCTQEHSKTDAARAPDAAHGAGGRHGAAAGRAHRRRRGHAGAGADGHRARGRAR